VGVRKVPITLKLTPEQEAAYALDYGVSKADLNPAVRAEYDRLLAERRARRRARAAPDQTGLISVGGRPVDTWYRKRVPKTPGFDPGKAAVAYAWIMTALAVLAMATFIVLMLVNAR